eukprot:gene450-570_t
MKPEHAKLLTYSVVGFSACATAILLNYFINDKNKKPNLQPFSTDSTVTKPAEQQKVQPNNNNNNNNNNKIENEIPDIEDMEKKCGFCRPELLERKSPLADSIHEYGRHYFICSGVSWKDWLSKVYHTTPMLQSFEDPIKKYSKGQILPSIINVCDMPAENPDTIDLLVFPDMIKIVGLNSESLGRVLDFFTKHSSLNSEFPQDIKVASFNSRYIFVCAHKQKDERCGYCGPILMDELRNEIKSKGLESEIQVYGSSHVGGHKFAGNVLVFPPGNWYGYVTPKDTGAIIESTLNGDVIQSLFRGTYDGLYKSKSTSLGALTRPHLAITPANLS